MSSLLFVCVDALRPSQQVFSLVETFSWVAQCLDKGHNTVPQVRPEPATLRFQVKHFTIGSLRTFHPNGTYYCSMIIKRDYWTMCLLNVA